MSPFMSSMPPAGLMEMPPVSNTTPLPMKATGLSLALPPFHFITTRRGGRTEPWATPSSAPMPSFFISFSVRMSISTPSADSASARAANSTGPRILAGSLTRSRASMMPRATASAISHAFLDAARFRPSSGLLGDLLVAWRRRHRTSSSCICRTRRRAAGSPAQMRPRLPASPRHRRTPSERTRADRTRSCRERRRRRPSSRSP
jgi:hypothetical protein